MDREQRIPTVPEFARSGRTRGQIGLRLHVGSRASLPGRIFPFLRARGIPRSGQPTHETHQARPRHHQITTNQPHRVAERVSTLDQISGGRVELGMGRAQGPRNCIRSAFACATSANGGKRRSRRSCRCSPRRAGNFTANITIFRRVTSFRSRFRSRIRRYGSRAPTSAPSARPGNGAWARSASVSFRPTRRGPGSTSTITCICISRGG